MPSTDIGVQSEAEDQLQRLQKQQEAPPKGLRDADLRTLLQAFLTRADLEAMVTRLEEVHRRDLKGVRAEVQHLTDRLKQDEASRAALEERITQLEQVQTLQNSYVPSLQLRLEEVGGVPIVGAILSH